MGKVYTFAEVAEHKTTKDCWIIIGGKVYDVTKFLEDHPGGFGVMMATTGKDATGDFEDVGHSADAKATRDKLYIGDVDMSTIPDKAKYTPQKQSHHNQGSKLLQFLAPLAILGLAVAVMIYTKSS